MRFKTDVEKFMYLVIYIPLSSGVANFYIFMLYFHFSDLLGVKAVQFHTFLEQR